MKILIADNEPLAVVRLSRLVTELGHQLVAVVTHSQQLIEGIQRHLPDVILLDLQMLDLKHLSYTTFLAQSSPMPAIVFCTAFEDTFTADQSQAEDYLLKPIVKQELAAVLEHLSPRSQTDLNNLKQKQIQHQAKIPRHKIVTKTHRGVELIAVPDIYYFLADQKYIAVRHRGGTILIDETLKKLECEFQDKFIRIHRNALVAVEFLEGLESLGSGQYQVRCRGLDERLLVSRRHLSALRERIQRC